MENIEIFSGEKFLHLCDHILGTSNDFSYNPKNLSNICPQKLININDLNSNFNNGKLICCYNTILTNLDLMKTKLKFFQNNFILIIHNALPSFNEEHLKIFDEVPNLKKIFTKNMNTVDPRVFSAPIGLSNSQYEFGNINKLKEIRNHIQKSNLIYLNFNISTNIRIRQDCFDKFTKKGVKKSPIVNFETYLRELSTYKFCISPDGAGIECHRTWESMWLKVIPICLDSIVVRDYKSKGLPVIIVKDWDEIDLKNLDSEYDKVDWNSFLKYLDWSYYKELILSNY